MEGIYVSHTQPLNTSPEVLSVRKKLNQTLQLFNFTKTVIELNKRRDLKKKLKLKI